MIWNNIFSQRVISKYCSFTGFSPWQWSLATAKPVIFCKDILQESCPKYKFIQRLYDLSQINYANNVVASGPKELLRTIYVHLFWECIIVFGNHMTECKIRLSLGCTEPELQEIANLHRKQKNQITQKIRCWKNHFRKH